MTIVRHRQLPLLLLLLLPSLTMAIPLLSCRSRVRNAADADDVLISSEFGPCNLTVSSRLGHFQVSLVTISCDGAGRVTVTSGGRQVMDVTSVTTAEEQPAVATATGQLRVGVVGNGCHVTMRARAFAGCPPSWRRLDGFCYGAADADEAVDFETAQRRCNSMRSNLLHLPGRGSPRRLRRILASLAVGESGVWIGMRRSPEDEDNRESFEYIDGTYYSGDADCHSTSIFSCSASSTCIFAVSSRHRRYGLMHSRCNAKRRYLCSSPIGGTDRHLSVTPNWIIVLVFFGIVAAFIAVIFGVVFVRICICSQFCSHHSLPTAV